MSDGHDRDGHNTGARGEPDEMPEDLTPEERMAFRELPREAEPSGLLEERIVRVLRGEGVLEPAEARRPGGRRSGIPTWMLVGSVAASLILFASGVLLGHQIGKQSTAEAFMALRAPDASHLALRIQEAGSAYVAALAALGDLRPAEEPRQLTPSEPSHAGVVLEQGREAALGTLYGAAFELARLDPGDADVLRVLQILEDRRARQAGLSYELRNVIWF